jgi:hypothetical protein
MSRRPGVGVEGDLEARVRELETKVAGLWMALLLLAVSTTLGLIVLAATAL